jgi:quinol monooxygenase YgiN
MIKIIAKFTVKENKSEEFKGYAAELTAETRKEAGCISYQLLQDINNGKILTFVEEWYNQEAIDNHNKSKHFQAIVPKLMLLLEKDPEINHYSLVV